MMPHMKTESHLPIKKMLSAIVVGKFVCEFYACIIEALEMFWLVYALSTAVKQHSTARCSTIQVEVKIKLANRAGLS